MSTNLKLKEAKDETEIQGNPMSNNFGWKFKVFEFANKFWPLKLFKYTKATDILGIINWC